LWDDPIEVVVVEVEDSHVGEIAYVGRYGTLQLVSSQI